MGEGAVLSPVNGLAALAGVLLATLLLGVAVWVVGIAVLASLVSRETVTAAALARAGLVVAASGVLYTAAAIAIALLVPA